MSTTPPPQPPPPAQSYERPYYGHVPIAPPSGELVVFLIAWLVVLIVTLAADSVDWTHFVTATVVLAAAYILARGIAKAGRVYEGR
jgi:hypothetical protein